jgi:hypothetical protein
MLKMLLKNKRTYSRSSVGRVSGLKEENMRENKNKFKRRENV